MFTLSQLRFAKCYREQNLIVVKQQNKKSFFNKHYYNSSFFMNHLLNTLQLIDWQSFKVAHLLKKEFANSANKNQKKKKNFLSCRKFTQNKKLFEHPNDFIAKTKKKRSWHHDCWHQRLHPRFAPIVANRHTPWVN